MTQATSHKQNNYIAWFSVIVIVLVVELVVVFAFIPIREAPHDDLSPAAKEALAASEEAARAAKRAGRTINHAADLPKEGMAAPLYTMSPDELALAEMGKTYPAEILNESAEQANKIFFSTAIQLLLEPDKEWVLRDDGAYKYFMSRLVPNFRYKNQTFRDILEAAYADTARHYGKI